MAKKKLPDLKRCGGWCDLSWTQHNEGNSPGLALQVNDFHFSTSGPDGKLPTWGYCTMVDIPNDQGWFAGSRGQDVQLPGIGTYLCFGEERQARSLEVEESLFFDVAACKSDEDVLRLARKTGPLGWKLDVFFFDGHPCQSFEDKLQRYRSHLENQTEPDSAELARLDMVITRFQRLPYLEDWRRGALPSVPAERVQDWLITAQEVRDAIEVRQLLEEGEFEEVDLRYPVAFDEERIDRGLSQESGDGSAWDVGELWGHGLLNYWVTFVTNLERRRPGFINSRRHKVKWLYSEFLLFVINMKIAKRIWPSYRLQGPQWRYDSLFAVIWNQLAEFVVKYPEHTQCKACSKWFLVQGKARGRGKKTCSPSCRVRLSQKRKAARDAED